MLKAAAAMCIRRKYIPSPRPLPNTQVILQSGKTMNILYNNSDIADLRSVPFAPL